MAQVFDRQIQRRSPYSSVNATVKKGGAGGAYTWGGATDVIDFEPVGYGTTKVVAGAVPVAAPVSVATQSFGTNILSQAEFPTLGVGAAPRPVQWGPSTRRISTPVIAPTSISTPIIGTSTVTVAPQQVIAAPAQPIVTTVQPAATSVVTAAPVVTAPPVAAAEPVEEAAPTQSTGFFGRLFG